MTAYEMKDFRLSPNKIMPVDISIQITNREMFS